MIVPALLVQTTAAAANPPILYDWRPPLTRGWANRSRSVTCVRGLMNSGTNFARSLVEQVGGVTVLEDRKHMYPWVLEARAQAAPGASVALVIARHPLSWVTGMRKAPYFLTCGSRAPDSPCWLRLVWRHGPGEQAEREHLDVKYGGVVDVWNAYYGGYLAWSRTRYALIRYEDLLLNSDRTLRALFPGAHHAQQRRAAKRHGHARSFADARAYNLAKRWRAEKFTEPEVAGHCARANATVLANLGYTCP